MNTSGTICENHGRDLARGLNAAEFAMTLQTRLQDWSGRW